MKEERKATDAFTRLLLIDCCVSYSLPGRFLESDQKYTEDEKRAAKKVKMACWNNEAQCGLKTQQFGAAKKCCDKVLELDSQNLKALYRRAQSYIATRDYLEASQDLKNALLIDPECREAKLEMKRLLKLQVRGTTFLLYSRPFLLTFRFIRSEKLKDQKIVGRRDQMMGKWMSDLETD